MTVTATALAQNTALTLAGSAAETVTGLVGDIAAGSLTGALTVTTGNAADNGISITTGSAATSITASGASDVVTVNATALAQNTALTLMRLSGRDCDRTGREYRGWLADRCADGDDGGCRRQHHIDHDRLGGDLDHRERRQRYRDGQRDGADSEYADAFRVGGGDHNLGNRRQSRRGH